jgi:hypothetical protein
VRFRLAILLAVAALASGRQAGTAGAQTEGSAATVGIPVRVSSVSPFAEGCEGFPPSGRVYRNSVVEPSLAVDPVNPLHLVAAWQQDRWASAGANGQVSSVSWDGGASWAVSLAPFSRCQGGSRATGTDFDRISDPWVSIAPNGDVYQMTIAYDDPKATDSLNAMLVSKSTDGGITWNAPSTLIVDSTANFFNDKNSITADPEMPGYVYAVWQRELVHEETDESGDVEVAMFTRSTDGGQTWETPRAIVEAPGQSATGNIVVVLPSGDLVDVFALNAQLGSKTSSDLKAIRSADKGLSWSEPVEISPMNTVDLVDPLTTFTIRPTPDNIAGVAVDSGSGVVYTAWTSGRFSDGKTSDIAISSSSDGGVTWTPPTKVNDTPNGKLAFVPTVAVLGNGSVGVSYYDLRNNRPESTGIQTNHVLAFCSSSCSTSENWKNISVTGPFNLERAPYARGFFVGDYMGLAGSAKAFDLLYVTPTPSGDPAPTAAFFATVMPP